MHILAGLGNPGARYARNRHNVGFMAVDRIARRHSFGPWSGKFQAETAEGELAGQKVLLIKPQTFMNLSGESVGKAMRYYRLSPADLTVLYDELDLAPGKIRVKTGGGAGGHNGIRSIDAHCGKDYHRVRIGIGHPGDKSRVTPYVLSNFSEADQQWLDALLDTIAEYSDLLVLQDHSGFMNRVSLALKDASMASPAKVKGKSHIRQARPHQPPAALSGPMAAILKKLLGKE